MLEDYCNQTAVLQRNLGNDGYGSKLGPEETIICRKIDKVKLVKDRQGNQVVSNTTYFTPVSVKADDKIDGSNILAVGSMTDLEGETVGYEVNC